MKNQTEKRSRKNGFQSDDDKIRYKINKHHINNTVKSPNKLKPTEKSYFDDDNARYKFPPTLPKPKLESKPKPKSKIKVNFWSNKDKQSGSRLHHTQKKNNRRHTVAVTESIPDKLKLKPTVRILKRVSFLPTPLFSDNHIPMVTVPDDLTIQLNEEEANDLHEDLHQAFVNSNKSANSEKSSDSQWRKSRNLQNSPNSYKRKQNHDGSDVRIDGNANELEFFSKYVVQKLRKMETNQRIYSENLINTVLMLGQLGKLNGKSKIGDA